MFKNFRLKLKTCYVTINIAEKNCHDFYLKLDDDFINWF